MFSICLACISSWVLSRPPHMLNWCVGSEQKEFRVGLAIGPRAQEVVIVKYCFMHLWYKISKQIVRCQVLSEVTESLTAVASLATALEGHMCPLPSEATWGWRRGRQRSISPNFASSSFSITFQGLSSSLSLSLPVCSVEWKLAHTQVWKGTPAFLDGGEGSYFYRS